MLTAYQLHLPSDLRVFQYMVEPTYHGADAVVFDGLLADSEQIVCRSYLFFERWLEIFVTFDDRLALRADPVATFPFAFNCDLTTPYHRVDDRLFTTDLSVDVLVAADGMTYQVKDVAEFEAWYSRGAFGSGWYKNVRRELAALTQLLETNQFLRFLNDIAPFPVESPRAPLSVMDRAALETAGFEPHPRYPRHH